MSHSTDVDDQRILRSGKIGVVERSEGEGVLLQVAGQESHEGESAEESRLMIDESCGEEEVVESSAGLESQCSKRGGRFGEIDVDDSSDGAGSESAIDDGSSDSDDDDDDAGSMHSAKSDARHDLDYLCDVEGKLLSELLVAG